MPYMGLKDLIPGLARGLGAVALAALLVGLGACDENGDTPVVAEELTELDADNVVYGMTQILTREGVREAVVEADTAYFYQDSSAVHLRGVHMTLFEEGGAERARVEANRGRLQPRSREMVGRGDVVLTISGEGGRRIETDELHYSSTGDRIWSDTYTIMEEDGEVTCGTAFRSDLDFENVYIEQARTANCRP